MAEVMSPNDLVEEMMNRLEKYFSAGAKLVWIIHPTHRKIYNYESPFQVKILGESDELDGGNVVPGFRIPIRSLFPT